MKTPIFHLKNKEDLPQRILLEGYLVYRDGSSFLVSDKYKYEHGVKQERVKVIFPNLEKLLFEHEAIDVYAGGSVGVFGIFESEVFGLVLNSNDPEYEFQVEDIKVINQTGPAFPEIKELYVERYPRKNG